MEYRLWAENNIVYCNKAIRTPVGRVAWLSLTSKKEPRPDKNGQVLGQAKYELTFLFDKADKDVEAFVEKLESIGEGMVEMYNTGKKPKMAEVGKLMRDGDQSDHEKYPQEKGMWVLKANNKDVPDLFDAEKNDIEAGFLKAGMICKGWIIPRLSSGGVGYAIEAVQFLEDDGVRYGGTKEDYRSLADDCASSAEGVDSSGADQTAEEPAEPKSAAKTNGAANGNSKAAPALSAAEKAKLNAEAAAKAKKGGAGKGKAAAVNLL